MYYVIDFDDRTEGLYTLRPGEWSGSYPAQFLDKLLPKNIMITTDPDLEGYSAIVPVQYRDSYLHMNYEIVKQGIFSPEAARSVKHMILLGNRWEVIATLKRVDPNFFEFGFAGGERLFVSEFGLGEPVF